MSRKPARTVWYTAVHVSGEISDAFLNEMPKYINPNSALACCWVGTFDRFAPFGIADEDKPHELDETIQKYRITQAGFGGMNHLCPDMEIGLREGWKGLLEKIRYYRKKKQPAGSGIFMRARSSSCWGSWNG
mgnify:CR=1 FL=1